MHCRNHSTYICSILITELFIAICIQTFWSDFSFFGSSYQLLCTGSAQPVTTGKLHWVIEESIAAQARVAIKISGVFEDLSCDYCHLQLKSTHAKLRAHVHR